MLKILAWLFPGLLLIKEDPYTYHCKKCGQVYVTIWPWNDYRQAYLTEGGGNNKNGCHCHFNAHHEKE
jgi:hypothetical protein